MDRNRRIGEFEKIQTTKGLLRLAKTPGSGFDAVWSIPAGFRVRLGPAGAGQFVSWSEAEALVAGRAKLKLEPEPEIENGRATVIPSKKPQERIPEQWEGRRAEYLRRKA